VDLADGVVLVFGADGTPEGAGFVVSDTLLVTCSHVVQPCCEQSRGEPQPRTVDVIFHATGDMRAARASAKATVVQEWWRGCAAGDIAFLRVDQLPDGVCKLPLGSAGGVDQDAVRSFGYPGATGEVDGLRGGGRVLGLVRESGRPLLQLQSSEITSGFSGGPLWDCHKRRVIGVVTSVLKPDRYGRLVETAFATPTTELQAICPALGLSDVCPYVRLKPFDADDAEFFFGRERLVETLVAKLRADPRFLALLGPSGSGKSSVIRAGLVPRLAAGDLSGSREWEIVIVRPGADPFSELAQAGLDGKRLAESLGQRMHASGHRRVVLVIDQFEELLVTTPAPLRADYVAQLADVLDSSLPVTVVLVMRNDFYGRLGDSAPVLLRWVEQGLVNVLPLERNELAEIVAEPAKRVGLDFDEGLVEVIIEEALRMRAEGEAIPSTILPLVEFTLTELWEQSHQQGRLTHQAYRALGGISGALTQWADGAYHELDHRQRSIARSIFLDLVHVADEEEGVPDTRERKDRSSLCPAIDDRESVDAVVDKLATKRLVITGGKWATVELIHDALIREWRPLRIWIGQERPFRRWLQETEPALRSWLEYVRANRAGEEPDWLRGRRLGQAEECLENRETDLSSDLKGFIQESMNVRDEEAERRRKQLASEQERQQALRVSESLRLASEARQVIQAEPDTAFLVAWEAVLRDRNELTESVFRETLSKLPAPVRILLPASERRRVSAGFVGRGDAVFAGDIDNGAVGIWGLDGTRVSRFTVEGSGVMAVASAPGVNLLFTWRDQVLRLHRIDGTILNELPLAEDRSKESISQDLSLSVTQAGTCLVHVGGRGWIVMIDRDGNTLRLLHSLTFTSDVSNR
jgi:Novel STAND NTPase 1/Trypsin-like peptidase domain